MSPPSVMEGLYTRIFKTAPRRVRDPASDDSRFTAAGTLDGHRHAWVALLTFQRGTPRVCKLAIPVVCQCPKMDTRVAEILDRSGINLARQPRRQRTGRDTRATSQHRVHRDLVEQLGADTRSHRPHRARPPTSRRRTKSAISCAHSRPSGMAFVRKTKPWICPG